MMNKVLAMMVVTVAWLSSAQTTTIQVPQGSGVFPTIGQVDCLEELGSGRLCAAVYECSGGASGELWGDMANHDGRRAIGASSPVANERDCVVTVDGEAAVRWFSGYRPNGRTGDLVGLTTLEDALRPLQRVQRPAGEVVASLLDYILGRYNTSLAEIVSEECSHIQQGHSDHDNCVQGVLNPAVMAAQVFDMPYTRCRLEDLERECEANPNMAGHSYCDGVTGALEFSDIFGYGLGAGSGDACYAAANDWLREHGMEFDDEGRPRLVE